MLTKLQRVASGKKFLSSFFVLIFFSSIIPLASAANATSLNRTTVASSTQAVCTLKTGDNLSFKTSNGSTRVYNIYVPPNANSSTPAIVSLHGSGWTASGQRDTAAFSSANNSPSNIPVQSLAQQTATSGIAAREGFIAIYPQAAPLDTRGNQWDLRIKGNDTAFLGELVRYVHSSGCSSPTTTTISGFSMGSMMTARTLCAHPTLFSGAAMVAGIYPPVPGCKIPPTTNIVGFHNPDDWLVKLDGTMWEGLIPLGMENHPYDRATMMKMWATAKGCSTQQRGTSVFLTHVIEYLGCPGVTHFLSTWKGQHTWDSGGVTTSEYIWAVMKPESTGAIKAGPVALKYATGGLNQLLGVPVSNDTPTPQSGVVGSLRHGKVYWAPATGAWEVYGGILIRYRAVGGEYSPLGLPVSGENAGRIAGSRVSTFQGGKIYWSGPTGAQEVYGGILARYSALGAELSPLRLPTTGETAGLIPGSRVSSFQGGKIYWSGPTGAQEVYGGILARYSALGAEKSVLGLPTSGEVAGLIPGSRVSNFQRGKIYWSAKTGAWEVYGGILGQYNVIGAERSRLGLPTSGEGNVPGGRIQRFTGGTITWNATTGKTTVLYK